jgi:hypothetical protein
LSGVFGIDGRVVPKEILFKNFQLSLFRKQVKIRWCEIPEIVLIEQSKNGLSNRVNHSSKIEKTKEPQIAALLIYSDGLS